MKHSDLPFAVMASLALHAALFLLVGSYQGARVTFEPGVLAVTLNILPSVAGPAAEPAAVPAPEPPAPPAEATPAPESPSQEPVPMVEQPTEEPAVTPHQAAPAAEQPVSPAEGAAAAQEAPVGAATREVRPGQASSEPGPPGGGVGGAGPGAGDSVDANGDLSRHGVPVDAAAVDLSRPEYPFYSRRHGEEGTVVVEVEVLAAGRPGRIEVVTSSGYSRLDQAAVDALKAATYSPARRAGVPITTTKKFEFTFKLEGSESE